MNAIILRAVQLADWIGLALMTLYFFFKVRELFQMLRLTWKGLCNEKSTN